MEPFDNLDKIPVLTADEAAIVESVRRLANNEIRGRAGEVDKNASFPWDNINDINRLGLNGIFIPEGYGGAELSYSAYLLCVREIARACASTGIIWATNFHAIMPVVNWGSDDLKSRVLPRVAAGSLVCAGLTEPMAGSDAMAMRTRFTPEGDDIIVNGSKVFITNGDVADFYIVFGKWAELGDGKKAISILVIERGTPGLSVLRLEDKMGHRGSSTAALSFDNCRVPRANLIGDPGGGVAMMHRFLNKSRLSVSAHALGIARAAFEDAVEYVNSRSQSGRRVVEFQGVQFLLADLAVDLALCERWLWHLAAKFDAGGEASAVEASMLKLRASDTAMRIATEAVQLHGGYGYCRDFRVERLMRDAKVTQIWEGTNQIHRQIIGRSFMER